MPSRLEWHGDQVKKHLSSAAAAGMNEFTDAVAEAARRDHPGWQSQTGEAERSIKAIPARDAAGDGVTGAVGYGIARGLFLEVTARGHPGDRTVTRAVERLGSSLGRRIARRFGS